MAQKCPIEQITIDDSDDEGVNNQQVPSAVNIARGSDHVELQDELEETEQQQLAQAIALSLLDTTVVNSPTAAPASGSQRQRPPLTDRQLDEKARLERQREREKKHHASNGHVRAAGPSPIAAPAPPAPKRSRPNVVTFSDLPRNNAPNIPSNATASTSRTLAPPVEATRKQSTRFWEGAIRRVHNVLAQPDTFGESFTFAQLVAADQKLEMAIVGSYCLELEWVCSHFKAETPVMLFRARHSDDHPSRYQKVDDLIKPQTFLILPERSLPGPWKGTMHTKLLIFYYKSFCRIVIPTANCVEHDWSIIDNAFYVHDFPVLQDTPNTSRSPEHNPTHTPFSRGLLEVMLSLGLTKKFTTPYRHFDFSSSAEVRLIATTQGVWKGFDRMEQGGGGLCALAKAVQEITSPSPGSRWTIEYQGSSMSKCSDNWLAQFYGAAAGIRPRAWFRPNIKRPAALPANTADLPLKIVYPTMDEIRNSHLGEPGGGTIFCRRDMWQSASRGFASLFHRGQSKRDRVAAHTKTMVALRKPPRGASAAPCPPSYKHEGYIYVGSHNFGPSAWGQLEHSSDTKEPQLKCNNYELGVLVPIRGDSDAELEAKASEIATYRRPLVPYGPMDEPWIQVPLD
ncbi:BZ3500_MvSof-1268-A1-R1_Chr5-2g07801 [Microbotryum saponariae]|uniref:BZ3500_MvSof-1268-A1-R1_Chr5-2g07801 protein n=1 Tax=Microbotryum saponariae TaxID=289078 RepID=A0A2X0LKA9_9BASI|nr:BZ3500_MvSof-1268-A1-R1_Chr5-2g07801 [Microbotryum saponariae]SDA05670.1 BZ3501_MvSof-1269-A2-R1_Chr5-2g07623 [Microbotryum saponariae]